MSNNKLKPTNEEIAEYIYMWIDTFRMLGYLTINNKDEIVKSLFSETKTYSRLRQKFAPVMYNSIEEWKENN